LAESIAKVDLVKNKSRAGRLRDRVLLLQALADAEDDISFWVRAGMPDELLEPFAGFAGGVLSAGTATEYRRRLETELLHLNEVQVRGQADASNVQSQADAAARSISEEVERQLCVRLPACIVRARERPRGSKLSSGTREPTAGMPLSSSR